MRNKQKFKRGDLVYIAADLGPAMTHFTADTNAIVIGSYKDQYGGDNIDSYTVMFYDGNECSWYYENQLTFLKYVGEDEIIRIKEEEEIREELESKFEWIVSNWNNIRENVSSATICELMRRIGITNPWGANGEGLSYYINANFTFELLDPVLSTCDIKKVEDFIEEIKRAK